MKSFLLSLAVLFTVESSAQIQVQQVSTKGKTTVGQLKQLGSFIASITYDVVESDTIYTLMYANLEYTRIVDIKSFDFQGTETLNGLYDVVKTVFTEENRKNKDYQVTLTVGKTPLIISTHRMMGSVGVKFFTNNGWFVIWENQVDKLFGKK